MNLGRLAETVAGIAGPLVLVALFAGAGAIAGYRLAELDAIHECKEWCRVQRFELSDWTQIGGCKCMHAAWVKP